MFLNRTGNQGNQGDYVKRLALINQITFEQNPEPKTVPSKKLHKPRVRQGSRRGHPTRISFSETSRSVPSSRKNSLEKSPLMQGIDVENGQQNVDTYQRTSNLGTIQERPSLVNNASNTSNISAQKRPSLVNNASNTSNHSHTSENTNKNTQSFWKRKDTQATGLGLGVGGAVFCALNFGLPLLSVSLAAPWILPLFVVVAIFAGGVSGYMYYSRASSNPSAREEVGELRLSLSLRKSKIEVEKFPIGITKGVSLSPISEEDKPLLDENNEDVNEAQKAAESKGKTLEEIIDLRSKKPKKLKKLKKNKKAKSKSTPVSQRPSIVGLKIRVDQHTQSFALQNIMQNLTPVSARTSVSCNRADRQPRLTLEERQFHPKRRTKTTHKTPVQSPVQSGLKGGSVPPPCRFSIGVERTQKAEIKRRRIHPKKRATLSAPVSQRTSHLKNRNGQRAQTVAPPRDTLLQPPGNAPFSWNQNFQTPPPPSPFSTQLPSPGGRGYNQHPEIKTRGGSCNLQRGNNFHFNQNFNQGRSQTPSFVPISHQNQGGGFRTLSAQNSPVMQGCSSQMPPPPFLDLSSLSPFVTSGAVTPVSKTARPSMAGGWLPPPPYLPQQSPVPPNFRVVDRVVEIHYHHHYHSTSSVDLNQETEESVSKRWSSTEVSFGGTEKNPTPNKNVYSALERQTVENEKNPKNLRHRRVDTKMVLELNPQARDASPHGRQKTDFTLTTIGTTIGDVLKVGMSSKFEITHEDDEATPPLPLPLPKETVEKERKEELDSVANLRRVKGLESNIREKLNSVTEERINIFKKCKNFINTKNIIERDKKLKKKMEKSINRVNNIIFGIQKFKADMEINSIDEYNTTKEQLVDMFDPQQLSNVDTESMSSLNSSYSSDHE